VVSDAGCHIFDICGSPHGKEPFERGHTFQGSIPAKERLLNPGTKFAMTGIAAFAIAQVGTIYTTGTKIAEHGGDNPGDREVPLVVYAPGTVPAGQSSTQVETARVAPTILKLLGLSGLASGRPAGGHASPARPRQRGLTAPASRAVGRLPAAPQLSTRPGRSMRLNQPVVAIGP